jgi:hypothetical protein
MLRVDNDPAMCMLCTSRLGVRAPIDVFNGNVGCCVVVPMSLRCQFRIVCRWFALTAFSAQHLSKDPFWSEEVFEYVVFSEWGGDKRSEAH